MSDQNETTFGKILAQFPQYLFEYLLGFVEGALCDMTITSLTIASLAIGYASNWKIGVAAFFAGHFVIRVVNALSSAHVVAGQVIGQNTQRVASGLHHIASLISSPQPTDDDGSEA